MWTRCKRSQRLRGHSHHFVHVVNNCVDMDKTTPTLLENFEGFSQILKEQSDEKKVLGCFYNPNSNNLIIWKKNLHVSVVVVFADTLFSIFVI